MLLVHVVVVGDVVAVVAVRGHIKRLQPDARDAEPGQIVEAAHQPFEIAYAIAVGILVFLNVEAVDNRVLVPEVVDGHPRAGRATRMPSA